MTKTFKQQRYPISIKVQVTYSCWADPGHTFTDEIKGLNKGHAIYLARLNWPSASVTERTTAS